MCLGDALQGGSQPAETLERLRELQCPVVMGNADAWLITGQSTSEGEKPSKQQREVRAWSLAQLMENDIAFIQQFHSTLTIPLEGGKSLLCFHGSPVNFAISAKQTAQAAATCQGGQTRPTPQQSCHSQNAK